MGIRVFLGHNLEIPPMPTNVNVNAHPSVPAKVSKGFSRTAAEGGTTAAIIGLLIAVGLVLFAVGINYLVGPTDLPDLGQFIGS